MSTADASTAHPTADAAGASHGLRLERVVLPVRPGHVASERPPVRIFLGTEPSQYRAERVFLWSIEQVRDPSRRYEISFLSELAGFDRRGWTTGFTNYRFAIPHLCGNRGRAIYNDEDQIYLADPAELFDLEMEEHGYLSIEPGDTSVMLVHCERMADVWTLARAQGETKKALHARARQVPGLHGELAPEWNARDAEYRAGRSKCLHYTTLHTQPWRPFPSRFSYRDIPEARLWHELEASAHRAGFNAFTSERPSSRYREALSATDAPERAAGTFAREIGELARRAGAATALEFSRAKRPPLELDGIDVASATLASLVDAGAAAADLVVCVDGLEHVAPADAPWAVDALFARARRALFLAVALPPRPRPQRGMPPVGTVGTADWWLEHLRAASAHHPDRYWELAVLERPGSDVAKARFHVGGRRLENDGPPRVWVLCDDKPGNWNQSLGLAQALGWPFERKDLRFHRAADWPNALIGSGVQNALFGASKVGLDAAASSPLEAPWPDLVIAAGRRTAPIARWIQSETRGRTRLVQLGRKGANPADPFDLAVAPAHCRLAPHPKRLETTLPLAGPPGPARAEAAERWRPIFAAAKAPHIALLVGGDTVRHRLDAGAATELGRRVARMAEESGGSVFVTTSRRTSADAVAALRAALPEAAHFYAWSRDDADANPYQGYLALADALVVTGESESMVADACATGKPVSLYPLAERPLGPLARVAEAVVVRALAAPQTHRGTIRPQQGLEYLCSRLLEAGILLPVRDLSLMHRRLFEAGAARPFDGHAASAPAAPAQGDLERVVARVRALMGVEPGSPEST
ncbi:MAG: mitochondrial fission ELM1 family protein [Proteobacteria bacterium]|nr:mitochondrial fission ELM1 family protein [Pseudomonadota bacterium]